MKKLLLWLTAAFLLGSIHSKAQYFNVSTTLYSGTYTNVGWPSGATITIPLGEAVSFTGTTGGQGNMIVNGKLSATGSYHNNGTLTVGPNATLKVTGLLETGSNVLFDVNSTITLTGGFSPYGPNPIEIADGAVVTEVGPVTFNAGHLHMDAGSELNVTGNVDLSNPDNFIAGALAITGSLKFNQPVTTLACPGSITTTDLNNASREYAIAGAGFIKVTGNFTSSNALTNSAAIVLDLAHPVGSEKIGLATPGTSSTCITTLPIYLSDFKASVSGSIVKINWTTSTEINNQQFVVERSVDGVNYQTVVTVASKAPNGTSTKDIAYEVVDNSPVNGNNIYRLKQIDLNGKTTYYNLTSTVNFTPSGALSVYPNPASSYIQVNGAQSGDHYTIYNLSGAKVITAEMSRVDITSLAKGLYLLQVIRKGKVINSAKFLKN